MLRKSLSIYSGKGEAPFYKLSENSLRLPSKKVITSQYKGFWYPHRKDRILTNPLPLPSQGMHDRKMCPLVEKPWQGRLSIQTCDAQNEAMLISLISVLVRQLSL